MRKLIWPVAAIMALGVMLLSASIVSAQYPPGIGSVSASASSTSAPLGGTVNINCTVLDSSGLPVQGADCTFSIVSQPGNDASVGSTSTTKQTNAQGIATTTLFVGTTPGPVVVSVDAAGVLSQVTVNVGGVSALPSAGGAPASPDSESPVVLLLIGGGILTAIAAASLWKVRSSQI
ncbi:MAG TPA: hypothetical protein VNL15_03765 [Dehalococcoidia bacterium]|nr:hypothetical protein [Dehalococcoidia bacterium]